MERRERRARWSNKPTDRLLNVVEKARHRLDEKHRCVISDRDRTIRIDKFRSSSHATTHSKRGCQYLTIQGLFHSNASLMPLGKFDWGASSSCYEPLVALISPRCKSGRIPAAGLPMSVGTVPQPSDQNLREDRHNSPAYTKSDAVPNRLHRLQACRVQSSSRQLRYLCQRVSKRVPRQALPRALPRAMRKGEFLTQRLC
jgi:hypothetical protein